MPPLMPPSVVAHFKTVVVPCLKQTGADGCINARFKTAKIGARAWPPVSYGIDRKLGFMFNYGAVFKEGKERDIYVTINRQAEPRCFRRLTAVPPEVFAEDEHSGMPADKPAPSSLRSKSSASTGPGALRTTKSFTSARVNLYDSSTRSRDSRLGRAQSSSSIGVAYPAGSGATNLVYSYTDYDPVPTVLYARTEQEADNIVGNLRIGPVGFDLEWRVVLGPKRELIEEGPAALVQVCDGSTIALLHVKLMKKFPAKLKALIESSSIPKLGVSIRNDAIKLFHDYGVEASNLVELGALAGQADANFRSLYSRPIVALAKVVDFYLQRTLEKPAARQSNWEEELTEDQRSFIAIAQATNTPLSPEEYTIDLAKELEAPRQPPAQTGYPALPEHMRAYTLWKNGHGLLDICIRMRNRASPMKESDVLTLIVRALNADASLTFSFERLKRLLLMHSYGLWAKHEACIMRMKNQGRGRE
ncbi:ribonuclease H-like domain-containing protein [Amylostereum chailletii]|nr:ribonuclease H-like domain-containing protein [Amylostereum chailletii]